MDKKRKLTEAKRPRGFRSGGASPGSAQHLAARLAEVRSKKTVKSLYGKALR